MQSNRLTYKNQFIEIAQIIFTVLINVTNRYFIADLNKNLSID